MDYRCDDGQRKRGLNRLPIREVADDGDRPAETQELMAERAADPLRLRVGLHLTVGVVLVVLVAASLLSGGTTSVASWYFGILPMSAAFFTSVRATMTWMGLCMASVLGMAFWEQWLPAMPRAEPAVLQVTGHLTLILFSTVLGLAARVARDQFVAQLACSLAAEQRAVDFFDRLARIATADTVRSAAEAMREDEREHVVLVEAWLRKVPRPAADWADDPDPPRYTD